MRKGLTSPYAHNGKVFVGSEEGTLYAVVYVTSRDRHLYVLGAKDGKVLWRHKMFGYPSSPTAAWGMVYFSAQGRVYGLSAADHKMRWCFPLGFSVATSPVVNDKRIYTGTLEGKMICLKLKAQLEEEGAKQVLKQFMDTEYKPASE